MTAQAIVDGVRLLRTIKGPVGCQWGLRLLKLAWQGQWAQVLVLTMPTKEATMEELTKRIQLNKTRIITIPTGPLVAKEGPLLTSPRNRMTDMILLLQGVTPEMIPKSILKKGHGH
jgi:hypothetical protein